MILKKSPVSIISPKALILTDGKMFLFRPKTINFCRLNLKGLCHEMNYFF